MRMFLVGMCDIFLILYLTGLTHVQPAAVLTVDDFFQLKEMHDTMKADKEKEEKALEEQLRKQKEEKEKLLAKQKELEELASKQKQELAEEKKKLETQLAEEKKKAQDMEKTLTISKEDLHKISEDLKSKEEMLSSREQLLAKLNDEIKAKEEARKKMEASFKQEIQSKEQKLEENKKFVEQLKGETKNASQLVEQMKQEAQQAKKAADVATTIKQRAVVLKQEALRAKAIAERKAKEALAARQKAEEEKQKALEVKQQALAKAEKLEDAISTIKQNGDTAYKSNILPKIQDLDVSYVKTSFNKTVDYEWKLTLLPIKIDGSVFVILPSKQIGFTSRSDRAPDELSIIYKGNKITSFLINKKDDLIAIELPGFKGETSTPYPADKPLDELMPTLLSIRDNGNIALSDKIRGISDNYFIVSRDFLKAEKNNSLRYVVKGFRGTGARGERIVRGDQLIDLNGQLIGISNNVDKVLRINSLKGWEKMTIGETKD